MAYQVIARKWRPQKFSDMVGQEHIARTLRNAIISGRIAQAYLFVGPRGIGKTTSARIFAKALNCLHPVDGEPCCECESCVSIANESSVDVIEIDAATHTQVEKAREICEEVLHLPICSKYKIYIIDEVHMLSKSAWNALLKTIEEPPEHAKFIFATTEVNKVLPTVISRCQRFDLKRIPTNLIAERLALIAHSEGVQISDSAIDVIARAADGGMRDAQSLLDQMISFFGTADGKASEISEAQALSLFGLTAPAEMQELIRAILCNDRAKVVSALHEFAYAGKNLELLFDEILGWLRGVLMCALLPNPQTVLEENPEKIRIYSELAKLVRPDVIQRLLEQLSSTGFLLREAINKQIFIETLLLKAMRMAHAVQVDDLIARLNYIRQNGELAPLNAVPTYVNLPPPQVIIQQSTPAVPVQPAAPQAAPVPPPAPAEKKTPDPVTVPEPAPTPAPEPAPRPVPPPPPAAPAPSPVPPPPAPMPEQMPEPVYDAGPEPMPEQSFSSQLPPLPPRSEQRRVMSAPTSFLQDVPPDEFDEDDGSAEPIHTDLNIDELLGKRKSVEELIQEVKDVPLVQNIINNFHGKIVDVHEVSDQN